MVISCWGLPLSLCLLDNSWLLLWSWKSNWQQKMVSFGDLNPFPLRQIRNRHTYHLEKVRLELTELEAIREDFLRERDTSPDRLLYLELRLG
uniref:Uncharacterized protein n=1 Tax=Urocitellus parryii TaxID=9999 RepID=A0A8D2IMT4_UROPR